MLEGANALSRPLLPRARPDNDSGYGIQTVNAHGRLFSYGLLMTSLSKLFEALAFAAFNKFGRFATFLDSGPEGFCPTIPKGMAHTFVTTILNGVKNRRMCFI